MADMVIVTQTDYVTVYPSKAVPTPVISQVTLRSSPGILQPTSTSTPTPRVSTSTASSVAQSSMPISSESSMAHLSTTGLPPLPSGWPTPTPPPAKAAETKPWDDSLAKLSLAGIIIMALILLSMIGYAIFQRFRGKCDKCAMNEDKLRKWQSGELKRITKDMVKARETLNSQVAGSTVAPNASDIDLEAGIVRRDFAFEQTAHRETALAALNRPRSVVHKPSLFERAKGAFKPKGKRPPPNETLKSPSPAQPSPDPSHDRFFAVAEPVTVAGPRYVPSHQPYAEDYNDSNERLNNRVYDPPRPKNPSPPGSPTPPDSPTSIYSYDGGIADKFAVRPLPELPPIRSLSPN